MAVGEGSNSGRRVHPSMEDVEQGRPRDAPVASAPPLDDPSMRQTAPLMPKKDDSSQTDKDNGARVQVQFPKEQVFPRREYPRSAPLPPPKRRRSCCCRCLCCTLCFLLVFVLAIAVAAGVLYLVFQPRAPKYGVSDLRVNKFSVDTNAHTLSSEFSVTVTARNPNKKIGIYYLDDSHVSVWYEDISLCSGAIPAFYQGHKNTTVLALGLTGTDVAFDSEKVSQLREQNEEGKVHLKLRADVPVKVKVGLLKLFKVTFKLRCNIQVDRLAANSSVSVSDTSCSVRLKL
eukprot:TRINITY_DN2246_c0_g1_i1.p1 TRINITY_DN2246_c0_g1~~TRINITY_DN2246_c0_g1_i1.p1  ORF type:complete len:288 (-),score=-6.53 TRINITY_DN2246_c0_g1_i1:99-962(-)